MKKIILGLFLLTPSISFADTPPPGTVKAKTFSGDGVTSIGASGSSLNVNLTNSVSGSVTANQGTAGAQSWLASITASALPTNACKETGGHLASIDAELGAPLAVTGTFFQATQPVSGTLTCNAGSGTQAVSLATLPALTTGAATIGAVNINGTVPISGTITATNSANGATGSTVPAQATMVGGTDGTNLRALKVSSAGVLSVDGSAVTQPVSGTFFQATQPVSGTFWQATQPVSGTFWQATQPISGTVTANAGTGTFTVDGSGHTQPVSGTVTANIGTTNGLALDASVTGLQVSQGSTSSGQKGDLVQGAVTTAAPSYTTAQTSPLSLTTAGALRTDASATTQPVSGTFWQATQPISGTVTANAGTGTLSVSQVGGATDSQTTGTVSTVITLTAPSNAQGFILQNLQTSTANLRFAMGATATTSLGMQLAPGQDSGYVPTSANVTLVSESGTQNYNVQWVAR